MTIKRGATWVSAGLLFAACGGTSSVEPTTKASEGITGGSPDAGDPTVGIVFRTDTPELCTGVLVAPFVVLTAAHCVDVLTTPITATAPGNVTFYTGPGQGGPSTTYNPASDPSLTAHSVQQIALHSGFTLNKAQSGCPNDNDVALLLLDGVAQVGDEFQLPTSAGQEPPAGATVTAIGYGVNELGEDGIRTSGTSVVQSLTAGIYGDALTVGAGPAIEQKGDSGGALVYNGTLVGVTMCHDPTVTPPVGWYTRVDHVAPWIMSTMQPWIDAWISSCGTECRAAVPCVDRCDCNALHVRCMEQCTGSIYVPHCVRGRP
jgi:hypothetical protein